MAKMLERSEAIARGDAPPPPVAKLIGFDLVSVKPGEAVVTFQATGAHANPMGTLHGGILCDIADAAMGIAYSSNLAEGESFTTLELKINFLKPLWEARLRAVGRVVKQGRTVGLVECDITDEKENLVARATSTCMTLCGDQAGDDERLGTSLLAEARSKSAKQSFVYLRPRDDRRSLRQFVIYENSHTS